MTNGDRIRQMSNEELAQKIIFGCSKCAYNDQCMNDGKFICINGIFKWLESDVEEGIKAYLESEEE